METSKGGGLFVGSDVATGLQPKSPPRDWGDDRLPPEQQMSSASADPNLHLSNWRAYQESPDPNFHRRDKQIR